MERTQAIMSNFKGKRILIIGDVMLDTYLKGNVERVSVEAPVPVVKIEQEYNMLGGSGNVASNIVSLGGRATLFAFTGNDSAGMYLKSLLDKQNIENYIELSEKTIQKIRIIGGNQQLARADQETTEDKVFSIETKSVLARKASEADIIIISDYAKGTINRDLMHFLSEYKHKIIVDPKPKNKSLYQNAFLITPNEKEVTEMTSILEVEKAGNKLKEDLQSNVLVTRGRKGMSLFSHNQINIPTFAREVFNVAGAGDTVIATLALSIASGASINEAAILANYAVDRVYGSIPSPTFPLDFARSINSGSFAYIITCWTAKSGFGSTAK